MHLKIPYVHQDRYDITVFQRAPGRGSIISVSVRFGFMEAPNVEYALRDLARHHQINLPPDPHRWFVHVSHENIVTTASMSALDRLRSAVFFVLRHIATPGHYYYGLGDEVPLTVEIMPVRIGGGIP